jgi:hypothetical protein
MSLDQLMESVPSYAKDLKLNFSSVFRQPTDLTEQQLWGELSLPALSPRETKTSPPRPSKRELTTCLLRRLKRLNGQRRLWE